ncbi:MAG: Cof-type HAD-IIB family hydrolase [Clostridiales bacterium]|nr:Cof-type HAD-IIB family hydrolase [Clostridiales bacterium]
MGKKIKLLALDLDGTLLNEAKQITPRTLAALERARQQGVALVPVTGRPAQGLPQAVLDLPELRYTVTSNGATIRDLVTGETLLEKHLSAETCLAVLRRSARIPMVREVFREGIGYLSRTDYELLRARYAGTSLLRYHLGTRRVLPGTVAQFLTADPRPVEELFFLTDSPEEKARLRQTLAGLPDIGFADPFPNDLEVLAGDIDKGEGLRYLLGRLGIAPDQVLAMGDGDSDLPLLQAAGLGVAMGNATDRLKAAADHVTASCDEDGVALAIETFVLAE